MLVAMACPSALASSVAATNAALPWPGLDDVALQVASRSCSSGSSRTHAVGVTLAFTPRVREGAIFAIASVLASRQVAADDQVRRGVSRRVQSSGGRRRAVRQYGAYFWRGPTCLV